jgi:tetratricopeptide (TPR) repeat protein
MNKLLQYSLSFRVYIIWSALVLSSLIPLTHIFFGLPLLSSNATVQEKSIIIISTADLINKAKYRSNVGNYTDALAYFEKVLVAEPNNTEALHGKGLTIDTFGNHTEAVDIYDKILEIELITWMH